MPVVTPSTLTIHERDVFLVTTRDCQIGPRPAGLYWADTRHLSHYRFSLDGQPLRLLAGDNVDYFSSLAFFTNPTLDSSPRPVPEGAIVLRLDRFASEDGVHEDYDLAYHGEEVVSLRLRVEVDADFADIFEVRGIERGMAHPVRSNWDPLEGVLSFSYQRGAFERSTHLRFGRCTSPPQFRGAGTIEFEVLLGPGQEWHT